MRSPPQPTFATQWLVIVPMPSIVVTIVSPGFRKVPLVPPTPEGVPVKMRSPGSSVQMAER